MMRRRTILRWTASSHGVWRACTTLALITYRSKLRHPTVVSHPHLVLALSSSDLTVPTAPPSILPLGRPSVECTRTDRAVERVDRPRIQSH